MTFAITKARITVNGFAERVLSRAHRGRAAHLRRGARDRGARNAILRAVVHVAPAHRLRAPDYAPSRTGRRCTKRGPSRLCTRSGAACTRSQRRTRRGREERSPRRFDSLFAHVPQPPHQHVRALDPVELRARQELRLGRQRRVERVVVGRGIARLLAALARREDRAVARYRPSALFESCHPRRSAPATLPRSIRHLAAELATSSSSAAAN